MRCSTNYQCSPKFKFVFLPVVIMLMNYYLTKLETKLEYS